MSHFENSNVITARKKKRREFTTRQPYDYYMTTITTTNDITHTHYKPSNHELH